MGFEPYTTEELLSYYKKNISELDGFDINHIYFVDDLQIVAEQYGINEPCDNMKGFTIPIDGCIVAILNGMNGFQTMEALFHELTHVRDFIWFSQKYNIMAVQQHPLYYALRIYSEIDAYYLGLKLTGDFLSKANPAVQQYMYESMKLEETIQQFLCCKVISVEDIARCLGYILLYDDFYQIENHMFHIPNSVSTYLRNAIRDVLNARSNKDIKEIDTIIHLLTD